MTRFTLKAIGRIALVTLDGEPAVLARTALESLAALLPELEQGGWEGLVLTGAGSFFCAGADIDEFPGIGAESAREGSRAGHELFGRIRALPYPTVAAINGTCLGGGVELALHCDARAVSSAVRRFACPEVFLGLVPGWGGTQLLPRLVGPEAAVRVVVLNPLRQNRMLDAAEAYEFGLADRLVEPDDLIDESLGLVRHLASNTVLLAREEPDWSEAETVFRRARARVDDAVHGASPAPYRALELIEGAASWTLEEGYRHEEDAIAELLPGREAQASIYAFDLVERRARRGLGIPDAVPRPIRKVGVVGAGLMATQIATLFARRLEVPLVMRDLEHEIVDRALESIQEELPETGALVSGTTGYDGFEDCDLVLEAVVERLDVKQRVFAELRERVAPGAVLLTNTSALPVAQIGADAGLHFFNPVAVMPLVEIVRHAGTSDEALATAWDVTKRLRKRGVVAADAPGFVVNRLLTRFTRVLLDALEHGNTGDEVDESVLSLGMPMAPSVVLQLVGPQVAKHVLETMHAAFPDRFPLSPALDAIARGDEPPVLERRPRAREEIAGAAMSAVADEIFRLLEDGVVADAKDVDTCLLLGAGWPFFLGGATKYLDQTGISRRVGGRTFERARLPDMAQDDWRVRVELEEENALALLERLGIHFGGADAHELAEELREHRLAVTHDEDSVFVYTGSAQQAEGARRIVEAELEELRIEPRLVVVEHWLADDDRWNDEPPGPDVEEELLEHGYAPWEVRVERESHHEARELADRLEAEGYGVVRRWRYLLVGAASRVEAEELAKRLHGRAEPSSEFVWEVLPQNPFAVFGGLGGTGTPV